MLQYKNSSLFDICGPARHNAVRYINFLYCIELLRQSNIACIDHMVAWQYGQFYNATWKDNNPLVFQFFNEHKKELYAFVIQKYINLTNKLLKELDNFKSGVYIKVALDPQLANSIAAGLQEVITDDNLMRSLISESQVNQMVDPENYRFIRHYRGAFTGIEVVDRTLCGVFDTWVNTRPLLNNDATKQVYKAARQDILDDRIYVCTCWMKKQILNALDATSNAHTFQQAFALYNAFFHLYASLFSILYHTVIPEKMHPDRLDNLYEKYITTDPDYQKYLVKARRASGLCAEAVADDKLPLINKTYLENTVLNENDPNKDAKFIFTATYPDSLVEKYLVTEYFVDKEVQEIAYKYSIVNRYSLLPISNIFIYKTL